MAHALTRSHSVPTLPHGPVGLSRLTMNCRCKLTKFLQRMGISTLESLDELNPDLPNSMILRSKVTLWTPDRTGYTPAVIVLRRTNRHLLLEMFKNRQIILNQPRDLLQFQYNEDTLEIALNARKGVLNDPQPEWWLVQFKLKRKDRFLLLCWHLLQDVSAGSIQRAITN